MSKHSTQLGGYAKLNEEQLRILDDVPGSAVELQAKDKASILINNNEFFSHMCKEILIRNMFFFLKTVLKKIKSPRTRH